MSEHLIDLAVTQFSANLEMKIQQKTSHLRGKVAEGSHRGRLASPVQYMSPIKMQTPQGRFAPKVRTDVNFERRWVFPADADVDQLIDTFDELRLISDPKSQYSSNVAAAVAREWDDRLLAASTATAFLGRDVDGLATESFDTTTYGIADDFGASAATGLTVAKLIELKRKFRHYGQDGNMDNEQLTFIGGSQQEADLLGQVQVVSTEFNERPVLVDGKVVRFLGFDFAWMERLPIVATNTRGCIAFMKSGLYLGIWKEQTNEVSRRYDLSSHPWDLYTMISSGAVRLEPGKLFQVRCLDTTGASITP